MADDPAVWPLITEPLAEVILPIVNGRVELPTAEPALSHQDIAHQREALNRARHLALQRVRDESAAQLVELQQRCGGIGHIFAWPADAARIMNGRYCVVCDALQPAKPAGDKG